MENYFGLNQCDFGERLCNSGHILVRRLTTFAEGGLYNRKGAIEDDSIDFWNK